MTLRKYGSLGYTWDEAKNRPNQAKHGIAFEDAVQIFDGLTIERPDNRFDYGGIRMFAIGLIEGLEFTVVFTGRENDERRIISSRRSDRSERREWRDHYGSPPAPNEREGSRRHGLGQTPSDD